MTLTSCSSALAGVLTKPHTLHPSPYPLSRTQHAFDFLLIRARCQSTHDCIVTACMRARRAVAIECPTKLNEAKHCAHRLV